MQNNYTDDIDTELSVGGTSSPLFRPDYETVSLPKTVRVWGIVLTLFQCDLRRRLLATDAVCADSNFMPLEINGYCYSLGSEHSVGSKSPGNGARNGCR